MSIGHAARVLGIADGLVRYEEQIGLIGKACRAEAGDCVHSQALRLIRRALRLGFTAERIVILLQLWRGRSNADVRTIALGHVEDLQRRIVEMQAMVRALEPFTAHRHGGGRPDRPILDGIAEERAALLGERIGAEKTVSARRRTPAVRRV